MNKDEVLSGLQNGVVTVVFEKTDGTERLMKCTLCDSMIPEDKKPKNLERKKNESVQPVFDLDENAWRSFRWGSVKQFSI